MKKMKPELKLCVNGSRTFNNYPLLRDKLDEVLGNLSETYEVSLIIGGALGADKLAEQYAKEFDVPNKIIPADWFTYGKCAGFIRNDVMAKESDYLISFWDGKSTGTKHMIKEMNGLHKPVLVVNFE